MTHRLQSCAIFGAMRPVALLIVFLPVWTVPALAQSQATKAQRETEKKQAALKKEEQKAFEKGLKAHMKAQDKDTKKRMKQSKKKSDKGNQKKSWKYKAKNQKK